MAIYVSNCQQNFTLTWSGGGGGPPTSMDPPISLIGTGVMDLLCTPMLAYQDMVWFLMTIG